MFEAILVLSAAINIFLLFYVKWLFNEVIRMNEEVNIINAELQLYGEHISSIYELEMFYGDETLKGLLDHGKEVTNLLKDFDSLVKEEEHSEKIDDTDTQ